MIIMLIRLVIIESLIACNVVDENSTFRREPDDAVLIINANNGSPMKKTYTIIIRAPSAWLGFAGFCCMAFPLIILFQIHAGVIFPVLVRFAEKIENYLLDLNLDVCLQQSILPSH